MTYMPREPEAFGEQVVQILRRHFPNREVQLAGPMDLCLDGRHLGLQNLYRMVHTDPNRGTDIVEDFLYQLLESDQLSQSPLPYSMAKPLVLLPNSQLVTKLE